MCGWGAGTELDRIDLHRTRGKDGTFCLPFSFADSSDRCDMNLAGGLRLIILILSTGAMLAGIAVMLGLLVPQNVPAEFRLLIGIVIFLYGAYRFAVGYFRRKEEP